VIPIWMLQIVDYVRGVYAALSIPSCPFFRLRLRYRSVRDWDYWGKLTTMSTVGLETQGDVE
jgi:hypothetical protein